MMVPYFTHMWVGAQSCRQIVIRVHINDFSPFICLKHEDLRGFGHVEGMLRTTQKALKNGLCGVMWEG